VAGKPAGKLAAKLAAELAAKLANCRCVMLLAKLQSWRPGDGLREAGQLSKKMKNNLREK
jgi:hypothetical protein